jgi:hypothetical protein
MSNFSKKTENQMLQEMQQIRAKMIESGKQVLGTWTQRILSERAAA